jgi:peptidoglycan/LPS O-acetylase OafA/YrhL
MKYTPGLDTVRALAVSFVIIHHWFPAFAPWMEWGTIGVDLFFFLSGFLITAGLIKHVDQPAGLILKNFYVRRTLRIFPLYYAVTIGLIIIGVIGAEWPWYILYFSNHYMYYNGWQHIVSHFWSLAVEEQFYIIWPVFVIVFSRKLLLPLLIVIAVSFFLRVYLANERMSEVLTITNIYKFAVGGVFAYYINGFKKLPIVASISFLVVAVALYFFTPIMRPLLVAIISFSLFHISLKGWLNFAPAVFLGKISYGIYILHNIVPFFIVKVLHADSVYFIPVCAISLVLCSWVSFRFFESPFLKLKKGFVYDQPEIKQAALSPIKRKRTT